MNATQATQTLISVAFLLPFLRPLNGLVVDLFKIMLRISVAGLVLQLIPADFIDEWSREATGWANIGPRFVPVVALIALMGLTTTNIVMLSGTTAESIIRIVLYVIGGVFTVGSQGWISWQLSVGELVRGAFGTTIGALQIIGVSIGA